MRSRAEAEARLAEDLGGMSGLAAPKVTILPGRGVDLITGERFTREEQEMCQCGTAYTSHNKSRHLKSHKHIEFMMKKERMLALSLAAADDA